MRPAEHHLDVVGDEDHREIVADSAQPNEEVVALGRREADVRLVEQQQPRLAGDRERKLEATNDALLARHAFGETREITVKGWGGEPVQAWITYPPNFDPKRKWPLLHSIHGGPHAAHGDGWHFRWNAHVFAGHGYVVPMVNYHGSSGFGQKFLETIGARYGEKEFADVEAATDALLRTGYIDRARLVGTGGSYGGFMVAYMNGHTDRYATYVCHAGCFDWTAMFADDAFSWHAKELGAWYWDDPAQVNRQSPHDIGHNKTGPAATGSSPGRRGPKLSQDAGHASGTASLRLPAGSAPIVLDARGAQTRQAMPLDRLLPAQELVDGERIALARLLEAQKPAAQQEFPKRHVLLLWLKRTVHHYDDAGGQRD